MANIPEPNKELLAENLATFFAKKRTSSERFCDNWKEEFYTFIKGIWQQQRDSIRNKNSEEMRAAREKKGRKPNIIPEPINPLSVEKYLNDKWKNLYPIYKNMENVNQGDWADKMWISTSSSLAPVALEKYKKLFLSALNNEIPDEDVSTASDTTTSAPTNAESSSPTSTALNISNLAIGEVEQKDGAKWPEYSFGGKRKRRTKKRKRKRTKRRKRKRTKKRKKRTKRKSRRRKK